MNYISMGLPAATVVLTLIIAWSSDTIFRVRACSTLPLTSQLTRSRTQGRRWPPIVMYGLANGIILVILAATPVWPAHRNYRLGLYFSTGTLQERCSMFWAWT